MFVLCLGFESVFMMFLWFIVGVCVIFFLVGLSLCMLLYVWLVVSLSGCGGRGFLFCGVVFLWGYVFGFCGVLPRMRFECSDLR